MAVSITASPAPAQSAPSEPPVLGDASEPTENLRRGLDRFFRDVVTPTALKLRDQAAREAAARWPDTFPPTSWVPGKVPTWPGVGVNALHDIPGGEGDAPVAVCFSPIDPPPPDRIMEISLMMQDQGEQPEFQLGTRWPGTQGSPLNLTWSFIPDGTNIPGGIGEPDAPSNLFARMDSLFNNNRATWIAQFQSVFDRWAALSGLSYTRIQFNNNEWDDGAAFPTSGGNANRGTIRIGMHPIDGVNGVLAYNQFPQGGDMVLDSAEGWGGSGNNYRFLRNVAMHEHGHGLGFQHVCPTNNTKLMEPFYSSSYDGPQQDDLRAAHVFYGDAYESNNGSTTAKVLADLAVGQTINPSTVPTLSISNARITSISRDGDVDWFRSSIASQMLVNIVVTPIGTNYADYPQDASCNNNTANENALAAANLAVDTYNSDAIFALASAIGTAAGQTRSLTNVLLQPGNIFVRVRETGTPTGPQCYNLAITGVSVPTLTATSGNFPDKVNLRFSHVNPATAYTIFRGPSEDRAAATLLTTLPGDQPAGPVSYDDTTVVPGTTYFYWVEATQAAGGSRPLAGPDSGFAFIPAPANNTCAGAGSAPASGTIDGNNSGSTIDGSSSCGGTVSDVWYSYTATCTGTVRLEITAAAFDPVLSVHTSCPGTAANQVACNDNFNGTLPRVEFAATGGTTYSIRIGSASGSGAFTLATSRPPVANDECAGAVLLPAGSGPIDFNTCNATASAPLNAPPETCGGVTIGSDLWFRYTAGISGDHTVGTCGSSLATVLLVYDGAACPTDPGQSLACGGPSCGQQSQVVFTAVAGQDYLIRVGAAGNATGTGTLTITPPTPPSCPADFNNDGVLNADDLGDFITGYFNNPPDPATDFNADGVVNADDLGDFITAYFNGC